MRTTVDLPDDIHDLIKYLAASRDESVSATICEIVREAATTLPDERERRVTRDPKTQLLVATGGPVRSAADVAQLLNDE